MAKTKEEIVNRYYELRDHAHEQLNKYRLLYGKNFSANAEIARLVKQHDEDTLGLRLGLKQKEAQVKSLQETLQSKVNITVHMSLVLCKGRVARKIRFLSITSDQCFSCDEPVILVLPIYLNEN